MSEITYDDKVDLQVATNIANINKVTASDMNEIKNVVNGNAEEVGDITSLTTTDKTSVVNAINELNAPEKWVSVGATAPTDGTRVWFEKGKNLFDGQLELGMYDETGAKATNNANYRNVAPINVQPSTTYTFSINGTSQKYVIYLYKKDGTFIRVNTLTSGTFTTPAEAYLLNFRCFNTDFTSDYANLKIQLEQGSTATTYEPYIEKSIKVDNDDFIGQDNLVSVGANQPGDGKRVWFAKGKNLYNKDEAIFGTISQTDGKTISSSSSVLYNPSYIKVLPNTQYTFSCNASNITIRLFNYTSSKSYINSSVTSTSGTSTSFTTSSTTYFIRFQFTQTLNNNMQLEEGLPATTYEPYVTPTINVDGEEWYNKTLSVKTKKYASITTASTGYYNLNLKCNEAAIIGYTHDPIASATRLQLYSNEQGWWFIRCSVNDGVYGERTITNLKIYYI